MGREIGSFIGYSEDLSDLILMKLSKYKYF